MGRRLFSNLQLLSKFCVPAKFGHPHLMCASTGGIWSYTSEPWPRLYYKSLACIPHICDCAQRLCANAHLLTLNKYANPSTSEKQPLRSNYTHARLTAEAVSQPNITESNERCCHPYPQSPPCVFRAMFDDATTIVHHALVYWHTHRAVAAHTQLAWLGTT